MRIRILGKPSLAGVIQIGLRAQILFLGISGVLITGAIYLAGLGIEANSQQTADRFQRLESLSATLSEGLLRGRELATEFLQKPSEKKVAAHDDTMKVAIGHLSEIESIAGTLPEKDALRQALNFRSVINNYTIRFSNVASAQKLIGYTENDGLQSKLRAAVHSVEAKLKTLDQPRLSVLMLMMRRHEKDFMLRGDEKYGDELKARASEFLAELRTADLPADAMAEIIKLVDTYKTSFLAFMAGQSTLVEEAEDLAQIYDRLRPNLDGVRKASNERFESVKADLAQVRNYVSRSILIAAAVMVLAALWFGRRLTAPLIKMLEAMDGLAEGQLDRPIERVARRDEIGRMSAALSVFHGKLLENRQLADDRAKAKKESDDQRKQAMLEIADGFEAAIGNIVNVVSTASSEIELAADELAKTAEATHTLSTSVSAASEQSSGNVQSAAAACEQMASSAAEISRQVVTSQEIAAAAVEQADKTNQQISELSKSADRIGEVVKMISAVAGQTNLLALNATIEAARAGEAGRGFAIVASEVKALAKQTATATDEITRQIGQIQAATQQSVGAIKEIGGTIQSIAEIAASIAVSVDEQGSAAQEVARNVQQAANGAAHVSEAIGEVNCGASNTGSAASQVHGSARTLHEESKRLAAEVKQFLDNVRVA